MSKFCSNCGAQLEDGTVFCQNCGAKVSQEVPQDQGSVNYGQQPSYQAPPVYEQPQTYQAPPVYGQQQTYQGAPNYGQASGYQQASGTAGVNKAGFKERSIALAIVFTIITCGIYGLYWMYKMNEEVNELAGETNYTSGGLVILLWIVTCNIYGWYWYYKMGEKVDQLKKSDSNKILFIVLAIFGLSIINLAIMQDTVNKEITG